ncbi:MAG: HRDC domain-containing protein [Candidatus Lernaella stagnicola]|nr:HRDC domain-containing protein [Candidatus Lernaella stagnicola]
MQVKVLAVPFDPQNQQFDNSEVETLGRECEILNQNHHFFAVNGQAYVALVISYQSRAESAARPHGKAKPPPAAHTSAKAEPPPRADNGGAKKTAYQPTELSPAEMEVFESLRRWRLDRAREMDVKPYHICSNRELEEIIRHRPQHTDQLAVIRGMSSAKIEAHGAALLAELKKHAARGR